MAGVAIEGDIGLDAERLRVYVTLFADGRHAHQAEIGLRAKPNIRNAVSQSTSAIRTVDRVLYVANGRGSVVDEYRLDEVVNAVGAITLPPSLTVSRGVAHKPATPIATATPAPRLAEASVASPDTLEQLRQLGGCAPPAC